MSTATQAAPAIPQGVYTIDPSHSSVEFTVKHMASPPCGGHAAPVRLGREGLVAAMRILGISGSLRRGSHNTALLRAAQRVAPAGIELELYDELERIPPYNEDRDGNAAPPVVARLRELVSGAGAVLIATPEYNGTIPGQLKTAVDWLSRPKARGALFGKPVAVIGASTGAYGGTWAQADLRKALGIAGARVVGSELAVAKAGDHLYEDGELADEATRASLVNVLRELAAQADPLPVAA